MSVLVSVYRKNCFPWWIKNVLNEPINPNRKLNNSTRSPNQHLDYGTGEEGSENDEYKHTVVVSDDMVENKQKYTSLFRNGGRHENLKCNIYHKNTLSYRYKLGIITILSFLYPNCKNSTK